jgi:hypothetical protein
VGIDAHRVAWHVEHYVGTAYHKAVGMDHPQGLGLGGVLGYGIVQLDVQSGIFQSGSVGLDGLLVQVYAPTGYKKPPKVTLHAGRFHEAVGIQTGIGHFQLVDDDAIPKQWQQLHIYYQPFHVGNGVGGMDYLETIDSQV